VGLVMTVDQGRAGATWHIRVLQQDFLFLAVELHRFNLVVDGVDVPSRYK